MGMGEIDRDEAESPGLMTMNTAQALDQPAFGPLLGSKEPRSSALSRM